MHEQLRRPDEVVVVQDGHVGLAQALQCGLAACRHDVVARMDADDISLPHRFLRQLPEIEAGADLVGAAVLEFEGDGRDQAGVLRVLPTDPDEIARTARWRNPFNHPTVVYRRDAVLSAGGYRELRYMEDYWVFTRMIADGAVVVNLPDALVRYRVDSGAYERKGGLRQLRSEVRLQQRLRSEGFTTVGQSLRNVTVRGGYRLVPASLRRRAYRTTFTVALPIQPTLNVPVVAPGHRHPRASGPPPDGASGPQSLDREEA